MNYYHGGYPGPDESGDGEDLDDKPDICQPKDPEPECKCENLWHIGVLDHGVFCSWKKWRDRNRGK